MSDDRRDTCELVVDLLRAARNGARKTQIFQAANTNHARGSDYLESCVEAGLLRKVNARYQLTPEGREVLDRWGELEDVIPVLGNSAIKARATP